MTEDLSLKTDSKSVHESLSLVDLLAVRMSYERATAGMCERFIEKAGHSKDPVVRALDLSPLQAFCDTLTEHVHLLTQALDVLADKADMQCLEEHREHFLVLLKAAERQAGDADIPVLPAMQALLVVEQFNEQAWGLLLALVKDAEVQRFIDHFERACMRHREQRVALQQAYEDIVLGLVRRNRVAMKSSRPLNSSMAGRAGMLFGHSRRFGRI